MPRVIIGRINRRPGTLGEELGSFHDEMEALVAREAWEAPAVEKEWLAGDLHWDATKNFVMGMVGFQDRETYFRPEDRSWVKARQDPARGGTVQSVVPFAIDARDGHQWIAFAQAGRVRGKTFRDAMTALLTVAAIEAGLMPAEWDVDPVVESQTVLDWIEENPEVAKLTRVVKFQNARPERYEYDRQRMQELQTPRMTEVFSTDPPGTINTDSPAFEQMLAEVEYGYIELTLEAGRGTQKVRFKSSTNEQHEWIDSYRTDFERGMSLVLDKLVMWVARHEQGGNHGA